jgi:hypothetical protein
LKLREFLVRVDDMLSDRANGPATLAQVDTLFRGFAEGLERRAKTDADGARGAGLTVDKVRREIAARFAQHAPKQGVSEADPVLAVLERLKALATKERDKWWRRRA